MPGIRARGIDGWPPAPASPPHSIPVVKDRIHMEGRVAEPAAFERANYLRVLGSYRLLP
ncbi:dihydroorotate dehydrogenase 2 [Thermus thermophilus]|nr:dihydroorotate dehydrogenase 2 [Thermus thermophilus]BDB11309.1 hypothetical protein TthTMY_10480 [Thermus thermophilus]